MRRLGWWRLVALVLALALVGAACDDDDEQAGTSDTTERRAAADRGNVDGQLKIGSVLPSTGDLAVLGEPMNKAVEMAIRDINEAGGVLGNDVTLVSEDSGTDENIANTAVDKLIGPEKVDVVIGAASSRVSLSVIDKITGAGVMQCSPSNTGDDFTTYDDNGFYVRTAPPDVLQGKALAELIVDDGHGTVVILHLADAYGRGFGNSTKTALEAAGGTVVEQIAYDPKGTNFDADVERAKAAGADAIVLIGFPETASIILKSMIEKGVGPDDIPIYLTDGTQSGKLGALIDPDNPAVVEGMKGTAPSAAPTGGAEFFTEDFAEFAPGVDKIFSAHAYDCAVLLALGAVAAESDDAQEIRDQINGLTKDGEKCDTFAECKQLLEAGEDIDYDGAAGPLEFIDAGEPGAGDYDIWQFTGNVETAEDGSESVEIETLETVTIQGEGDGGGDAGEEEGEA